MASLGLHFQAQLDQAADGLRDGWSRHAFLATVDGRQFKVLPTHADLRVRYPLRSQHLSRPDRALKWRPRQHATKL